MLNASPEYMPSHRRPPSMTRASIALCAVMLAASSVRAQDVKGVVTESSPGTKPRGAWVETPTLVPLSDEQAEALAREAARGSPHGAGPWAPLGGAGTQPLGAVVGSRESAWVAKQASQPEENALQRAQRSSVLPQVAGAATQVVMGGVGIGAALLLASVLGVGSVYALQRGDLQGAPLWAWGAAALGVLVGASTVALLGAAVSLQASGFAAAVLRQRVFDWQWRTTARGPHDSDAAPPARPLDERHARSFMASVAAGVLEEGSPESWLPIVGPALWARQHEEDLPQRLHAAREAAGLPRVHDEIGVKVKHWIRVHAVAWTVASAALPLVALMGTAATVGWVGTALTGNPLVMVGASAATVAFVGVVGVAALAMGVTYVTGALMPWWLARAASETRAPPPPARRTLKATKPAATTAP